jgi:hypothetical protein
MARPPFQPDVRLARHLQSPPSAATTIANPGSQRT